MWFGSGLPKSSLEVDPLTPLPVSTSIPETCLHTANITGLPMSVLSTIRMGQPLAAGVQTIIWRAICLTQRRRVRGMEGFFRGLELS